MFRFKQIMKIAFSWIEMVFITKAIFLFHNFTPILLFTFTCPNIKLTWDLLQMIWLNFIVLFNNAIPHWMCSCLIEIITHTVGLVPWNDAIFLFIHCPFFINVICSLRYGCQPYVMTPLLQPANPAEQRYNTAHKRGRCIIERTFGQMKRRFPCLKGLRLKLETTMTTIVAVTVLWNISLERREPEIDGPEVLHEIPGDIRPLPGGRNVEGLIRRDNLIRQHFV